MREEKVRKKMREEKVRKKIRAKKKQKKLKLPDKLPHELDLFVRLRRPPLRLPRLQGPVHPLEGLLRREAVEASERRGGDHARAAPAAPAVEVEDAAAVAVVIAHLRVPLSRGSFPALLDQKRSDLLVDDVPDLLGRLGHLHVLQGPVRERQLDAVPLGLGAEVAGVLGVAVGFPPRRQEGVQVRVPQALHDLEGRGTRERRGDKRGRGAIGQKPLDAAHGHPLLRRQLGLQTDKLPRAAALEDVLHLLLADLAAGAARGLDVGVAPDQEGPRDDPVGDVAESVGLGVGVFFFFFLKKKREEEGG